MDLQVIQNKIFEVRGCRVMLDFHLAELKFMDLQVIQNKIFEVRGCRVMLDFHLAELYQVET